MNSEDQPDAPGEESPAGGLAFGDILFTIFRHKFLILCSVVLGLLAAAAVRFLKPPNFESTAQIYVPFVVDIPAMDPNDPNAGIKPIGMGGDMQMNTEVELLKSFDTALDVADQIGPEKILLKYGGGSNRWGAAGVVASGISVTPPKAMSLTVTFSHRDPDLVQPVMQAIVDVYMRRHKGLRLGDSEEFVKKRDEAAAKLAAIEEQIKGLKSKANVPDIRQRQAVVATSSAALQTQIFQTQSDIDRQKADLGEISQSNTNTNLESNPLPAEKIKTYSEVLEQIEDFRRRRRTLLQVDDLTTNHPYVLKLDVKMQEQVRLKLELEQQYPLLTNYVSSLPRSGGASNSVPRLDLEAALANLKRLERTLEGDKAHLEGLNLEAFKLIGLERELAVLERQREQVQKEYDYNAKSVDRVKMDDAGSGKVVNIKPMQTPTPPRLNTKKLMKLIGMAFVGFVGLGLGIAFLIDMVLDRSIRRPAQIVRSLHMPVVLTIPDMNRKDSSLLPWTQRNRNLKLMRPDKNQTAAEAANAIAPWSPDNQLQSHIEGLRERVITHFDARNLDHHPKLVAVTACTAGAGVSTLASGLAASLSRTGNGSVLLVDMNVGEGVTHSFYKGKPGYGPSESIETESDNDVPHGKNLSLAKHAGGPVGKDRLAGMLPPGFNDLSPKLKADAYDYVVFDMTRISPASVTPRMSGRMDLVLFVIESEKTKDHTARHARGLMRESRANVVAVLNKYYNPVPEWLAHD